MPPGTVWAEAPGVEVRLRVDRRARRFTLRLESGGGGPVLTLPPGVPEREVRAFLCRHSDWLTRALAERPQAVAIAPGALIPVDGVLVELVAGRARAARLEDGCLTLPRRGAPGPAVAAFLKRRAEARIAPLARRHAETLGKPVARIGFRDTRSRWGSCSSRGSLSFSWRLAMAPPEIQAYVAAHEAAHLVEMNHSARYWAVLARLMPDFEPRRAWLKRHRRDLHRYDFSAG